jgi:hypothetical protein
VPELAEDRVEAGVAEAGVAEAAHASAFWRAASAAVRARAPAREDRRLNKAAYQVGLPCIALSSGLVNSP